MNKDFEKMLSERFGMFVHFGLYSALEGMYKGEEVNGLGEWIMHNARIPIEDYKKLGLEGFNPAPDFAEQLVKKAKNAGIKYIVLTSKHHDGFCLYNTKYSDYNSYNYLGRDLCKELADACRKEGLGVGFYYSHTLDWYEKDAGGDKYAGSFKPAPNRNDWDYPDHEIDFEKYLYGKCFPQVEELLTNYGDLRLIWFDFPHNITQEQSAELRDLVKKYQPHCLINSRIAYCCCDYYSLGDNVLPVAPTGVPLECLITLNDTWGYKKNDNNWKTSFETEEIFCRCLNSDATLLMNVGPLKDGSLTPETEKILSDMGQWTAKNKDAVYGNIKGNPFHVTFKWGYASVNEEEKRLYLYVTQKEGGEIELSGVKSKVKSITTPDFGNIEFKQEGEKLTFNARKSDSIIVYTAEFETVPEISKEINQCGDVLSLGIMWAEKTVDGKKTKLIYDNDEYGKNHGKMGAVIQSNNLLGFWTDPKEEISWTANFEYPGKYRAEIIHGPCKEFPQGKFTISVNQTKNEIDMKNSKSFTISRTKSENERELKEGGIFEIKEVPLKAEIVLSREKEGVNVPVSDIRFIKVQ